MKTVLKIWVYSNIHISIIAFLLSLESNFLLGIQNDLKSPLFVFFSTLFIYNLGYYRAVLYSDEAQRYHAEWMRKNRSYWIFSMLIALLAILYLFSSYSQNAQISIVFLSIISFVYIIHGINFNGFNLSIRNIPYLKTLVVSLVWTLITILPQLIENNLITEDLMWANLIAERFLFILPITLMFDIRDMKSDPDYLKTIPRLLGVKKTKGIAIVTLFLGFIFLLRFELSFITNAIMLGLYIIMALSIVYSDDKKDEFYYSAWFDGLMAAHAIIIIASFWA